jgi:hypothetical protein
MTATDRTHEARYARPTRSSVGGRQRLFGFDRRARRYRRAHRWRDRYRPHDGSLLVVGFDVVANGVLHALTALLTEPQGGSIGLAPGSPGRAALRATRRWSG